MNVLVCENEVENREEIKQYLVRLAIQLDCEMATDFFASGEELLSFYKNRKKDYVLMILDIEMNQINGVETARQLRENYAYNGQLVFLTSHEKYMIDCFVIGTNQYLLKPIDYLTFEEKLKPIIDQIHKKNENILVELVSGGSQVIPINEIYTIQSGLLGRKGLATVKTAAAEYNIYGKMNDLEKLLTHHHFFRGHKQTIINLNYVKSVVNETATMINGEQVKISRNKKREFKKQLIKYVG